MLVCVCVFGLFSFDSSSFFTFRRLTQPKITPLRNSTLEKTAYEQRNRYVSCGQPYDKKIRENEMGESCNTHGRDQKCTQIMRFTT